MGIFGLLSKDKSTIVNGAVDIAKGLRSMADDRNFTEEEASRVNIGAADAIAQLAKDTASEGTERSIARRAIAVFYVKWFCWVIVGIIVIRIIENWASSIKGTAEFAKDLLIDLHLAWGFMAVMAFFFGAHLIRQYQGRLKKKD